MKDFCCTRPAARYFLTEGVIGLISTSCDLPANCKTARNKVEKMNIQGVFYCKMEEFLDGQRGKQMNIL
jgi:hypothetical protein